MTRKTHCLYTSSCFISANRIEMLQECNIRYPRHLLLLLFLFSCMIVNRQLTNRTALTAHKATPPCVLLTSAELIFHVGLRGGQDAHTETSCLASASLHLWSPPPAEGPRFTVEKYSVHHPHPPTPPTHYSLHSVSL